MKIRENSDVLIINVPMDRVLKERKEISKFVSMPPLGDLYIISYLENAGYRVSFIDLVVELFDKSEFIDRLKEINPKIVGFTTYVESWNTQNMLAKYIKETFDNVVVVAGGHCASFCYKDMLENRYFEYCIRAEGEKAFLGLCNYYIKEEGEISDIPNLIYKKNDSVIENPVERIDDIDALPFPDRSVLDISKYSYPFTISTARGCPGQCIFCSAHAFWGNRIVIRTPEGIMNEIRNVYKNYGLSDFFVVDDTFTLIPKRVMIFCKMLFEYSNEIGVKFKWGCESRADTVSEDLLKAMKNSGCNMIQFGMESGNNTNVSFIIGHHEDTFETIDETITKAADLKKKFKANVLFSMNTPYPGTELYNKMKELGVELLVNDFSHLSFDKATIRTRNLTNNEIRRLYIHAREVIFGI